MAGTIACACGVLVQGAWLHGGDGVVDDDDGGGTRAGAKLRFRLVATASLWVSEVGGAGNMDRRGRMMLLLRWWWWCGIGYGIGALRGGAV